MSTAIDFRQILQPAVDLQQSLPAAHSLVRRGSPSSALKDAFEQMIAQLEDDPSLAEPARLCDRLIALDRLDVYFPSAAQGSDPFGTELATRARALCDRFEAANTALYEAVRRRIQQGSQPCELLRSLFLTVDDLHLPPKGNGYDHVDELIGGVLQFEEPADAHVTRDSEKLFFQPTPARQMFRLIHLSELTAEDVLVDLGSGLGHVPILVSIFTEARGVGIECEAAYIESARQCARTLNLDRVNFVYQDARESDFSAGTVFYLYTPFMGSILSEVLDRLLREASARPIRICSYGPCTPVIAQEPWLKAMFPPDCQQITVFCSVL